MPHIHKVITTDFCELTAKSTNPDSSTVKTHNAMYTHTITISDGTYLHVHKADVGGWIEYVHASFGALRLLRVAKGQ